MLLLLIAFVMISLTKNDNELDYYYDLINAYNLKIENTALFSELSTFIDGFGIPDSIRIGRSFNKCKTYEELVSVIRDTQSYIPTAIYGSVKFMIVGSDYVIPEFLDFRNDSTKVFLDSICFSMNYSIDDFAKNFQKSFKNEVKGNSFFTIHDIDLRKSKVNSFYLIRKSIDDENTRHFIELVFIDNKLGFMIFVNF